jgi:hypothetical protein
MEINIQDGTGNAGEEIEIDTPAWPEPVSEIEETGTPLFELKSRREKIASELVKSFQVARWDDPEIYCEFSIIEPSALSKALIKREKQKNRKDDWIAWAYCDILAPNCKRVYAVLDDDHDNVYSLRKGDPTGTPTGVDHDLAKALGLDPSESSASETFRKLFFSEGDLIDFATRVFRWSSIVNEEADEAF